MKSDTVKKLESHISRLEHKVKMLSNQWVSVFGYLPEYEAEVIGGINDDVFMCMHRCDGLFEYEDGTEAHVEYWMPKPGSYHQIIDKRKAK